MHKFYPHFWQFFKFGLVGLVNTVITLAIILVLKDIFLIHDYIANAIGYIVGFSNSFLMNKTWTFKSTGSFKRESFLFVVVFVISYICQLGTLILLEEVLAFHYEISLISLGDKTIHLEMALLIGMVIYTGVNFLGNKFVTFKPLQPVDIAHS